MNAQIDWDRLGRYLAGESSEEEEAEVRAWIETDPARNQTVEELQQICDLARSVSIPVDIEAAWAKVDLRTQQAARGGRAADRVPFPSRSSRFVPLLRIAASLTVIGLVALLLVSQKQKEVPVSPSDRTYTSARGQRATIRLADRTTVVLNAESAITIPADFGIETREVHVLGEAFLAVAPDVEKPFRVGIGNAAVEVLGTEFSVRSYGDNGDVRVAVVEGKVSVKGWGPDPEAATVLTRTDVGLFPSAGRIEVKRNVDLTSYLAWTEGRLSFEKAPLLDVVQELERWYDLDVRLSRGVAEDALLTATFTDEPVRVILNVVAASMKLEYDVVGRTVTFYPLKDHQ